MSSGSIHRQKLKNRDSQKGMKREEYIGAMNEDLADDYKSMDEGKFFTFAEQERQSRVARNIFEQ